MSTPVYKITANTPDGHQSTPGWCVAFVRYEHPACSYTSLDDLLKTKKILVIENDCIGVSYTGAKNSFSKSVTLTMKTGDIYYQNAVSPGDWVCVWIHENQEDIDRTVDTLRDGSFLQAAVNSGKADEDPNQSNHLNDWSSGLKFIGRVTSVPAADTVAQGGQRTITQTITCQMFTELASSVYFTQMARAQFADLGTDENAQGRADRKEIDYLLGSERFRGFADKFHQFMVNSGSDPNLQLTPDRVIYFLIVLLFGMSKDEMSPVDKTIKGNFNDAIKIPKDIANITGQSNAKQLWEFYTVLLGLQKYENKASALQKNKPWVNFNPIANAATNKLHNFIWSDYRCKGWVLFQPPMWTNVTLWNILQQYVNPTLNEMYTVLRCDSFNRIRPTIVVREIPFSTGLYNSFQYKKINPIKQQDPNDPAKSKLAAKAQDQKAKDPAFTPVQVAPSNTTRSMYYNIPRWVIDESMVLSVNTTTNESRRINFVQMWGSQLGNNFALQPNGTLNGSENYREAQFLLGNYVADDQDIERNGLRAEISETSYDLPNADGVVSHTPYWARIRADWLFNGHLKLEGSISLLGVTAPISEGDNVEVRGIVYHIESVTHSAMLMGSNRVFRTMLAVSNGILASSLKDGNQVPSYSIYQTEKMEDIGGPGVTDMELTGRPDRDSDGERIPSKDGRK